MIRVLEHEEHIYGTNYVFLYGTLDDVRAYGAKGSDTSLERCIADGLLEDGDGFRGRFMAIQHNATDEVYHVMFVRSDVDPSDRVIIAAHEALHATFSVLLHRGMELCSGSEESFTYLQGFLLTLMLKLMEPPTKKKRRKARR